MPHRLHRKPELIDLPTPPPPIPSRRRPWLTCHAIAVALIRHRHDLKQLTRRLERLTKRHEAPTQTVEMMAQEGARLLRLAENHERRPTRLEGGNPN